MQNQCVHNLSAPRGILYTFYFHAQTVVDAGDIRTWQTMVIWLREKAEDPQFEPHAGIKILQVLESPVYIYGRNKTSGFSQVTP